MTRDAMTDVRLGRSDVLWARFGAVLASQKANLQNLSVLVLVNFVTAGIGFITQINIANRIGREGFGLLAYGMAVAAYGKEIVRFGLDRTLTRDLIHHPSRFAELVATSLWLRWVLLLLVVGGLVTWRLIAGSETDVSWGLLLVIIANTMMSMDLQSVYDSWRKISRHAVYNLLQRSVYFVAIWGVILTAPDRLSIFWIGAATLGSVVLYLIIQQSWAIRQIGILYNPRSSLRMVIKMARANVTVWMAAMFGLSFAHLNQVLLKQYCGSAALGGYAAAWQITHIAVLFLQHVGRIGNPMTACITQEGISVRRRRQFLVKYAAVMLVTVFPITLAAVAFPELILRSLFRPEYASAANTMRVMGIYLMVLAVGIVASQFVVACRKETLYLAIVSVGGVVSLVLCLLLIPSLGSLGAALALLTAHSMAIGAYCVVVVKRVWQTS